MSYFVPKVRPLSKAEIERFAKGLIDRYYPHLLIEPGMFPILEFFDHVLVEDFSLDSGVETLSAGVEGITWPDGRVILDEGTYRKAENGDGRARFTAAHESFHGLKHRQQIQKALIDTGELVLHRRHELKPFEDPEWQADTFAAALLMPEQMVRFVSSQVPGALQTRTVANVFGVSGKAAEVRLRKLGLFWAN